ncbi:MAG TPA: DUF4270 family protein [Flavipsychrobacter sp.]|nr:DUF4270 family protein [Flavipsychrobacter sp.]
MKHRVPKRFAAMFVACVFIFLFQSCKEDTILGSNVIPVDDTANTFQVPDTLTIFTKTVLDDSLLTSISISGLPIYHTVGSVVSDPYGKTNAGFYFQVIPPSLGYAFPKTPDSAVMILPVASFTWGDTTLMNVGQTVNVYEIANSDSIIKDTSYYNFSRTAYNSQPIGSAKIGFNATSEHQRIRDSVSVLGQKRNPHVRIKLSQDFLNKFINEAAKASGGAMAGYVEFLRFQRGFYVATADSNVGNALYYFLLNGNTDFTRANIQFYYTEQNSGGGDTVKYASFYFDQTRNAHYNAISRRYTGTQTANWLSSTAISDSIAILQNEPGAALDIRIPNIKNLPKQPIIKAELIITQVKLPGDQSEIYFPPSRLYPVRITANGTESVQDRYPLSSSEPLIFMDGLRKDFVSNGVTYAQYTLNIPREVQKAIVEQRDTLHLRVSGAATFPGAYRLISGGRGLSNSDLRLKLRIFYSKI